MSNYRKAVITEDGRMVRFIHEGKDWLAMPSGSDDWFVVGVYGATGFGWSIWDAIEDAKFFVRSIPKIDSGLLPTSRGLHGEE